MTNLDRTDARLLLALNAAPRTTGVQLAAQLGLARNTVHSRMSKWDEEGMLARVERRVLPRSLGYPLRAFVTVVVDQHRLEEVIAELVGIPEVIEVVGISGAADLHVEVASVDADFLYRIAGLILAIPGVERTTMSVVMREAISYRTAPLLERLAEG